MIQRYSALVRAALVWGSFFPVAVLGQELSEDDLLEAIEVSLVQAAEEEGSFYFEVKVGFVPSRLGYSVEGKAWQAMSRVEELDGVYTYRGQEWTRGEEDSYSLTVQAPESENWVFVAGELSVAEDGSIELAESKRELTDSGPRPSGEPALTGYQLEFRNLINEYRRSRGLGKLTYDRGLEAMSRRNNAMGGRHSYFASGGQIWAMGSSNAAGSFRQWRNSPGHNAIMLGRGYTRVGIHYDGRGWTADFR